MYRLDVRIRRLPEFLVIDWILGRRIIAEIFLDFLVIDVDILVENPPLAQVAGTFLVKVFWRQPFISKWRRRDPLSIFVKLVKGGLKPIKYAKVLPLRWDLVCR